MVRLGLLAALVVAGCYDMERLDPGPARPYLLIDDFEDGGDERKAKLPAASQFRDQWTVQPFNADNNADIVQHFELIPGTSSEYALLSEFRLIDPGNNKFTGVNVGVSGASPLLDARFFEAIHFSIRFDEGGVQFPPTTHFYVQLGCDSAPTVSGGPPIWVNAGVGVNNDWQARRERMANFGVPGEATFEIDGDVDVCLARVDSVRFTVSTDMGLQAPVTGRLYLDDVYFE